MLALRDDGRMVGSVSGGCIEDDLMRRAREGALADAPARLTYGVTRDEAARFGLPCGGTLRLISEPLRDTQWLDLVLESIRGHRLIQRTVDLHDGASSVSPAGPADGPDFDGRIFRSVYGPRWRLLIIGANQTAQVLASVAATLDFHVTVCDPREEFHGDWNSSQATLLTRMPDDAVLEIGTDERTAIVAVTHDPKLDDMALLEALKSPRSTWARWVARQPAKAPRAAAAVRSGREPDRTPAWPGGPAHREQDAGRDRGGDRRRTDLGPQHAGRRRSRLQALASQRAPGLSRAAGPCPARARPTWA